ncbi:hypothetical protein OFN70_07555 [Campylobacter sp. CN_NE3]|uniref:hypothetical protein n=1 Tax=Campylobacter sp. CN_NE3 TaxID=2984149 RepID=UPI0022EA0DDD|nr:hypothetical protein [Campylobacter sp. CN_NE3]MDA3069380.1 hypothetical protein [Campylobacter sp. CN_NE3]
METLEIFFVKAFYCAVVIALAYLAISFQNELKKQVKNNYFLLDRASSKNERNFINFLEVYILGYILNTKGNKYDLIDMVESTDFELVKKKILEILKGLKNEQEN